MTITVLIADDHPIVRKGLRQLIQEETEYHIVAEADDGLQAVQLAELHRPDVLVVDMMMPGLHGLEVIRQVRQRSPATRILVLSMHNSDAYILQALQNGASGYLMKETGPAELIKAIQAVLEGRHYLSPPLSERMIALLATQKPGSSQDPYDLLTDREREVLHLAAQGFANPQIAERLSISPRTVEGHRTSLMTKLGLSSQFDLYRFALKRGLIQLE